MFANIIIDITHEKLDKIFQYRIPPSLEETLSVGMEVLVPFGRGNRLTKGYVVGFSETSSYDLSKIKEIQGISRKGIAIEGKLVALAAWMKENYGGTMIQALKTVLPIKQQQNAKVKKKVRLLLSESEGQKKLDFYLEKNQRARARLLAALLDDPILDYELVSRKLNITRSVIRALEEQGIVSLEEERIFRNPVHGEIRKRKEIVFTGEQRNAIDTFWRDYGTGRYGTYLIHGVTGSGKTEVYIEMIRRAVEQGRQAVMLIPEIALTFQTVMRFYRCFGERVSIMHSRLSAGERYDQMMRAKEGQIDVMIGPRSALFTPFPSLGLIVIDEEHENTYKSEQVPRYHARETAIARAEMEQASVVLGSATPSLEAMYRARKGEYRLLELKSRSGQQEMAQVYTVDLREELKNGNRSILSRLLWEKLAERLDKKEQIMLFLNRRGYAGFLSCRECGYVVKCPHCDVSLSFHKNGKMICHYCGYEEERKPICPECGSRHIGEFKVGTQQIEEIVKREFPEARVLRMDLDTTREKDGHEKILAAFANEEADILIGTQMIVKGHDFPNVTLVGVLAADISLYAADYRSSERTFQLLTQAAGRAGRGQKTGEAVIQTYVPDHYSIRAAARQDYEEFYRQEILYRKMMGYPPAAFMLGIYLSGPEETFLEKQADRLGKVIHRLHAEGLTVIGPAVAALSRKKDMYRMVIYLKHMDENMLLNVKNQLERILENETVWQKIYIQFDYNPLNAY